MFASSGTHVLSSACSSNNNLSQTHGCSLNLPACVACSVCELVFQLRIIALKQLCCMQILKPAEKKQKFAVSGAGNRPGTPPRAGVKQGVAPAGPAPAATKA